LFGNQRFEISGFMPKVSDFAHVCEQNNTVSQSILVGFREVLRSLAIWAWDGTVTSTQLCKSVFPTHSIGIMPVFSSAMFCLRVLCLMIRSDDDCHPVRY